MPTKIARGAASCGQLPLGPRAPAEGLVCPTLTVVSVTDGLPTPQLWYHPYQSGVEYSLKNRADEAGRVLFLVGTAIMASVAVYAMWRPRRVFDTIRIEQHELPIDDLGR